MLRVLASRAGGTAQAEEGGSPTRPGPGRRCTPAILYEGLLRGMRCGILAVDREGQLLLLNAHAREILELETEPAPGTPLLEALPGQPELVAVLAEAFTLAHLPNRAELEITTGHRRRKTIGFTLSYILRDDGTATGAALFFKDLTHVEHKEEQERLRDRLAALGQMAANLAHEIRNPLASIEVSCALLRRRLGEAPQGVADLLDKINSEIRRLNATITSSLEYVRPVKLTLAPVRIHELLDEALQLAWRRRGAPRELEVERRYREGLGPCLMDRDRMRQVFVNLFLNAAEAMDNRGRLTITTELEPAPAAACTPYRPRGARPDPWSEVTHFVVVRVRDTGPGIAPEHLDKLFYPFFTTKKGGSGVGLALAKKIVDSHRGLLDVRSVPGRGAEFRVRLPLVATEAKER